MLAFVFAPLFLVFVAAFCARPNKVTGWIALVMFLLTLLAAR